MSLPARTTSALPLDEGERRRRLEELFARHAGAVYGFARRRATPADAEEVVSDTFLVAWRRLDDVPSEPLPWLLNVARNSLANRVRGEGRQAALRGRLAAVADIHTPHPDLGNPDLGNPDLGNPDLTDRVAGALATLSPAEHDALTLLAWEGLSPDEAATVLGCSRAAIYLRLSRARRRFTRALGPGLDPEGTRDDEDD